MTTIFDIRASQWALDVPWWALDVTRWLVGMTYWVDDVTAIPSSDAGDGARRPERPSVSTVAGTFSFAQCGLRCPVHRKWA